MTQVRAVQLSNSPAPDNADIRRVREELRRIGGVVPPGFGKFSGKNMIDLLWGQSETAFDAGKVRIRFWDNQVLPVYTRRAFRVTSKAVEIINKYAAFRERKMRGILERYHLSGTLSAEENADYHALLFMPTEYILKSFVQPAEWEKLKVDNTTRREEIARLLPDNWFYLEDLPIVEEIGCPCFFVVQWCPPPAIDSRKNWERNRYGVQPIADLNGTEHFVDILGEYPKHGFYHNVLLKIQDGAGGYALPGEQNCLAEVRRMVDEARRRTVRESKTSTRVKNRAEREMEKIELASAARGETRREIMLEEGQVHIVGKTARIFPKKPKRPYWGKFRKKEKTK
jgi:hypothetical protein